MPLTANSATLTDRSLTDEAAAGAFLVGCSGSTRASCTTDPRIFSSWCHGSGLGLFTLRRSHLELFGRWTEQRGRTRSTVARPSSTLVGSCR
jgi:hypothetical protein